MNSFEYTWWHIDINYKCGLSTLEVKAKTKENAIKQIKKICKEEEMFIDEINWDTLRADRTGYARRF